MYTKDDFYIDNGYVVILGSKTYKLSDVKDIFLRGESMFLDFTDNTRSYENIFVNPRPEKDCESAWLHR